MDVQTYRDLIPKALAPGWLQGPLGQRWLAGMGDLKDSVLADLKAAVKQRLSSYADPDALEAIGWERMIERAEGETDASYASRLASAWTSWELSGTAFGVLLAFDAAGFTGMYVEIAGGKQYSLDGAKALVSKALASEMWLSVPLQPWFWSSFTVFFPVGTWITQVGSVLAAATNSANTGMTAVVDGYARGEWDIRVKVTTGPATPKIRVSLDAGKTWGTESVLVLSGGHLEDFGAILTGQSGITIAFSGALTDYNIGDQWAVRTYPQGETLRRLGKLWKSSLSTFSGVAVQMYGESWGWIPANPVDEFDWFTTLHGAAAIGETDDSFSSTEDAEAAGWPASGILVLGQGTPIEESHPFTRVASLFGLVPPDAVLYNHGISETIEYHGNTGMWGHPGDLWDSANIVILFQ